MTAKELERLERIAVQILAANEANPHEIAVSMNIEESVNHAISTAQALIKQLDALKIPE